MTDGVINSQEEAKKLPDHMRELDADFKIKVLTEDVERKKVEILYKNVEIERYKERIKDQRKSILYFKDEDRKKSKAIMELGDKLEKAEDLIESLMLVIKHLAKEVS